MSFDMTMPRATGSLPRRLLVRVVVASALAMTFLPPMRLKKVMRLLSRGAGEATRRQATDAYLAVISTSARCAGWRGCLPRSIAVAVLCRLRGAWPYWHLGVKATPPFAAHAWLEAEGRVVAERGSPGDYRSLVVVAPGAAGRA